MRAEKRREEFAELVARHQSQVYGFVRAMVQNVDDAQDLHQQSLTIMWQKFDQFEQGSNFLAWALKIAELEIRHFRRRHATTSLSENVLSQLAEVMRAEALSGNLSRHKSALRNCLAKLKERDRTLVEQVYLNDHRIKDIAEELGRLPQSISNSLRRIRRALFECIKKTFAQENTAR